MVDLKTIVIAILGGLLPALLWLWFWLKEDKKNPEPKGLLLLTFILGMFAVILVLPIEKFFDSYLTNKTSIIFAWATVEELAKYGAAAIIALRSAYADEPVDFPIYLITAALGFSALENGLFLLNPVVLADTTVGLLTGNLRFLGATLLHATSSAIIGIAIGLAFYKGWFVKKIYLLWGLLGAIVLHSAFNFFIMKGAENFFRVFGFLWAITIIILLLFEKLKRMELKPLPSRKYAD